MRPILGALSARYLQDFTPIPGFLMVFMSFVEGRSWKRNLLVLYATLYYCPLFFLLSAGYFAARYVECGALQSLGLVHTKRKD